MICTSAPVLTKSFEFCGIGCGQCIDWEKGGGGLEKCVWTIPDAVAQNVLAQRP